jgi:hypothetical protein
MADTTPPTIAITANKAALKAGDSSLITFTLSEVATDFVLSDIVVIGGALSNFSGLGMTYSATFTPSQNSTSQGLISVSSFKFSDAAGNANEDGAEANNRLTFIIDTIAPTISIRSNKTFLGLDEHPTIYFTLSEPSTNFDISDINVDGGALYSFTGSGTTYSVLLTPNSTANISIQVFTGKFTDASGNLNSENSSSIQLIPFNSLKSNVTWTRLIGTESSEIGYALSLGRDGSIYVAGETKGNLDGQKNNGNSDIFLAKYNLDGSKGWTRLLGTSGSETAGALTTGLDGAIYISGSASGNLNGQISAGSDDIVVAKYAPDGTLVWTRLLGTSSYDYAYALTTGLDGSIYVSGATSGNLDSQACAGSYDSFLTKFTPDGVKVWTQLLGTTAEDYGKSLAKGLDGSIYVGGFTKGNLDGQTNAGGYDCFVTKYASNGEKIWTRLQGTGGSEDIGAITTDLDGFIYLSGSTAGNLDGQTNAGGYDCFITKYASNGEKIWTRLQGSSNGDFGKSVTIGLDGSIYVSGYTEGSLDGQTNNGQIDVFVTKYSPDGTKVWTQLLGNSSRDNVNSLITGLDSSVYLSGYTAANLDGQINNGGYDAFLLKLTAPDTTVPQLTLSTNKSSLSVGETAEIIFTLSKPSTNFVLLDISVTGGTLSNFQGSGVSYSANFTANIDGANGASVSVGSGKFSDALGIFNEDGADTNNKLFFKVTVPPDTTPPTVAITSNAISLSASQTATITFTLSESSSNFIVGDISVSGGNLFNFSGDGSTYTALFTPTVNSTTSGTISVVSGVFTDSAGNTNADGSDANNLLILVVDTLVPTIAVSSNKLSLQGGDSATLNFTLSEASTNFAASDITVTGGTLSNFAGSGNSYTAIFTLVSNSAITGALSVANGVFTDTAGNKNADGSDANNSVSFARIPTITNETHTLSVIVDKNVLGTDAVLLKGLKELMTFTNGAITKHIVEYAGSTFDYNQIDSLIMTVTRDGEFTEEFTREINDYVKTELNITYSDAVAIVGAASIDGVILSVAGADGNYVG